MESVARIRKPTWIAVGVIIFCGFIVWPLLTLPADVFRSAWIKAIYLLMLVACSYYGRSSTMAAAPFSCPPRALHRLPHAWESRTNERPAG